MHHAIRMIFRHVMKIFFVKFFLRNVTSLIQPMDQGVISTMKRIYRKNVLRLLLKGDENPVKFWKKLTIFDAVQLIAEAWHEIQNSTLLHAWKKLIPGVIMQMILQTKRNTNFWNCWNYFWCWWILKYWWRKWRRLDEQR